MPLRSSTAPSSSSRLAIWLIRRGTPPDRRRCASNAAGRSRIARSSRPAQPVHDIGLRSRRASIGSRWCVAITRWRSCSSSARDAACRGTRAGRAARSAAADASRAGSSTACAALRARAIDRFCDSSTISRQRRPARACVRGSSRSRRAPRLVGALDRRGRSPARRRGPFPRRRLAGDDLSRSAARGRSSPSDGATSVDLPAPTSPVMTMKPSPWARP